MEELPPNESPAALRDKAVRARRLARAASRARLIAVADEFDARADALEGRGEDSGS